MAFTQANLSNMAHTGANAKHQNLWYYMVPGADDITAAHYFRPVAGKMVAGDIIFASDGKLRYVAAVDLTADPVEITTTAVNS